MPRPFETPFEQPAQIPLWAPRPLAEMPGHEEVDEREKEVVIYIGDDDESAASNSDRIIVIDL